MRSYRVIALVISVSVHAVALSGIVGYWDVSLPQRRGTGSVYVRIEELPAQADMPKASEQPALPVSPVPPRDMAREQIEVAAFEGAPDRAAVAAPAPVAREAVSAWVPPDLPEQQSLDGSLWPVAENDATPAAPGSATEAVALDPISPVYPAYCRREGQEGAVAIRVEISALGEVVQSQVLEGSGYERLDEAALQSVQKARFTPARLAGVPVPSMRTIRFIFALDTALPSMAP